MATAGLATVETPVGPFTIIGAEAGVLASGFTTEPDRLLRLIHPRLRPERLEPDGGAACHLAPVTAYFEGDLHALDRVPLVLDAGGPFLRRAWQALRQVGPGERITYGTLAARAGNPRASRAAGQACARNPTTLFVPCHRAVDSRGEPHRFGWGLPAKRWLLAHESGGPQGGDTLLTHIAASIRVEVF
ncbi:MAG: methylated-DNA--[protein]-cysteine S-methyltransferase [Candidatus Dormibacteraeota bacterium]|nr:methylated-DNA--[protein]-cysteine S-methyltransferase [Candidatus Dormibacteraeota bacterium]MBO0705188.1 methylated-DNA--[protein]-cysteine S-methyltransferase [Candidatus Dormibacteraeota bacterium]MBO0761698.1 methylated-DNA--[protein]-cysteine S-methyltransferase [Candidatus Dormibacteraeota bacterium]